ncbi:MAG TPA: ORF6N domain-containing protein [Gemmatimonadales bacterium]|jgi:hypothetical protein|nr:ORF6N domain-containing protein [Gemmatimonadales bacterium]
MASKALVTIEPLIVTIRGTRVILASDLAAIYGVETKALNQAVKRNADRFPPDFAFRLPRGIAADLQRSRSQSVTLKRGGNLKYLPWAFTEHGAVMAANVLNSPRAVHMSIFVVRAFLRLRTWVGDQAELAARLEKLENRVGKHDREMKAIIHAVRQLISPIAPPRPRIGFR